MAVLNGVKTPASSRARAAAATTCWATASISADVDAAQVLQHHPKPAGVAHAAHGRRLDRDHARFGHIGQLRRLCADDSVDAEVSFRPPRIGREDRKDDASVRGAGRGRSVRAGNRDHMSNAVCFHQAVGDLLHDLIGPGEGRPWRQLHGVDEITLIHDRDEAAWRVRELPSGKAEQADVADKQQRADAQQAPRQIAIAEGKAIESGVEAPKETIAHARQNVVLAQRMLLAMRL